MNPKHDTSNQAPKFRRSQAVMTWNDADSALLKLAIVAVTTNGGCIQLNQTRDGSQLILKVWQGTMKIEEYVGNPQAIDELLEWVASTCA